MYVIPLGQLLHQFFIVKKNRVNSRVNSKLNMFISI